jgi:nucleoid-associated protein YgaU
MMLDPAVKTAMAFCVVLGGVCAALWFRDMRPRPKQPPPAVAPQQSETLSIPRDRQKTRQPPKKHSASRMPSELEPTLPPMIPASPRRESAPALDAPPPAVTPPTDSRWDHSLDKLLPARSAPQSQQPRRHVIVDGDTLAALAERYLGSAARAGELFQANRDVLMDPQLLPIGVELRIPDR